MTNPVDSSSAEHYTWGGVCDGWRLLDGHDLSVIQERVPPGGGEVAHVDSRARQFFYVISGIATMELPGRTVSFGAGQGLHVPPNSVHRLVNASDTDLVFLVVSAPTTRGDRLDMSEPG